MGLDMYLTKSGYVGAIKIWEYDPEELKKKNPGLYKQAKHREVTRGNQGIFTWQSYNQELGYWRKANAIHNWFVKNVQYDIDNCDFYQVSKNDIIKLLSIVGFVKACFTDKGELIPKMKSKVDELLPPVSGFFFGSTEYDEWYYEDIIETEKLLSHVLEEGVVDWENDVVLYQSSW